MRLVTEIRPLIRTPPETAPSGVPLLLHPEWLGAETAVVQGSTFGTRADCDFGLYADAPVGNVLGRWTALRHQLGFEAAVHSRQLHGSGVRRHDVLAPGLHLAGDADGHLTRTPGVLLTVASADCVPVTLVTESPGCVALLHAGWRGVVAGIVEMGVAAFRTFHGVPARALQAHLGPAICGTCYEVGPEVHAALGLASPAAPRPVDLRAQIARRLTGLGLRAEGITCSTLCTRCSTDPVFHSHRRGDAGRQISFVGLRTP